VSRLDLSGWRALDQTSDHLRMASLGSVAPANVNAPFSTNRVDFRRVTGYAAGAPVLSNLESIRLEPAPGEPDDGLDNDGDGFVDEAQLVWIQDLGLATEQRTVLCRGVAETFAGEVPGNGADDNGNGLRDESGFCVDYDGSRLNVSLTLQGSATSGQVVTRTVRRTIVLRNDVP
jgi:hypothetical protein